MPRFFRLMFGLGMTMSGTAVAVQEALAHYDIEPDEWWTVAFRYLIGVGAGLAAASKLTQTYNGSGQPVTPEMEKGEKEGHNTVLDRDDN